MTADNELHTIKTDAQEWECALVQLSKMRGSIHVACSLVALAVLHWDLALSNTALVRQSCEASNGQHGSCGARDDQLSSAEGAGHLHAQNIQITDNHQSPTRLKIWRWKRVNSMGEPLQAATTDSYCTRTNTELTCDDAVTKCGTSMSRQIREAIHRKMRHALQGHVKRADSLRFALKTLVETTQICRHTSTQPLRTQRYKLPACRGRSCLFCADISAVTYESSSLVATDPRVRSINVTRSAWSRSKRHTETLVFCIPDADHGP